MNATTYYTMDMIKRANRGQNGHWFDADTMRFFSSRIGDKIYQGPGGIYFVSSEQFDYRSARRYTVRQFNPDTAAIDPIGPFNRMSRSQAHRLAAGYAAGTLTKPAE